MFEPTKLTNKQTNKPKNPTNEWLDKKTNERMKTNKLMNKQTKEWMKNKQTNERWTNGQTNKTAFNNEKNVVTFTLVSIFL